jgi:hypothetical protein
VLSHSSSHDQRLRLSQQALCLADCSAAKHLTLLSGADSLSSLERRRRPHAARGMSRAAAQGPPPGPGGAIAGDANAASLTERGGWEVALSGSCWPTADSRTQRRNVCSASAALHRGLSVSKLQSLICCVASLKLMSYCA